MRLQKAGISKEWLAGIWNQIVGVVTFLSMIVAAIYPAAVISNGHPGVAAAAALMLAVIFPICIFIHEIGHAVAAWLVGWRVHLIVVGSRGFAPRGRKFLRVSRQCRQKDLGGWVHTTPPPNSVPNKGAITVILGGAMGNLVLAALLLPVVTMLSDVEKHLYAVLVSLGGISVIYAIRNLVPTWSLGGWQSDGASLIRVIKGVEPSIYDQSLSRLFGLVYDDVPVNEWDVSVLREVVDGPADNRHAVDPIVISYAFCTADLVTARSILERYLETDPENFFDYRCMYAFIIAMTDRDAPRAAKILEALPGELTQKSFSFWRATAVTAHLLEKRDEALEAIRKARQFADAGGVRLDEDDESVFSAIERGDGLPRLEPRQNLSAGAGALTGTCAANSTR